MINKFKRQSLIQSENNTPTFNLSPKNKELKLQLMSYHQRTYRIQIEEASCVFVDKCNDYSISPNQQTNTCSVYY